MKVLYVTDLHGDKNKYWKSLDLALDFGCKVIVNGGDMLPKIGDRHKEQPYFINTFLFEYFSYLKKYGITYLAMLGNDDLRILDDYFTRACEEFDNIYDIAGRKVTVGDYEFIGMNYILDHPFGCKDRVVYETAYVPQSQLNEVACVSNLTGYDDIYNWLTYSTKKLPLMCDILEELPKPENPDKTVYVMHMPPAGLRLGQLYAQDLDIGSHDIYKFLKKTQPLLSLHGHIHESADMEKGKWINAIHNTACIQPGQTELHAPSMCYALLDLDKQEYTREVVDAL